jgi:hypothetical protein
VGNTASFNLVSPLNEPTLLTASAISVIAGPNSVIFSRLTAFLKAPVIEAGPAVVIVFNLLHPSNASS